MRFEIVAGKDLVRDGLAVRGSLGAPGSEVRVAAHGHQLPHRQGEHQLLDLRDHPDAPGQLAARPRLDVAPLEAHGAAIRPERAGPGPLPRPSARALRAMTPAGAFEPLRDAVGAEGGLLTNAWVLAAVPALVVLAACGGGEQASSSPSEPAARDPGRSLLDLPQGVRRLQPVLPWPDQDQSGRCRGWRRRRRWWGAAGARGRAGRRPGGPGPSPTASG